MFESGPSRVESRFLVCVEAALSSPSTKPRNKGFSRFSLFLALVGQTWQSARGSPLIDSSLERLFYGTKSRGTFILEDELFKLQVFRSVDDYLIKSYVVQERGDWVGFWRMPVIKSIFPLTSLGQPKRENREKTLIERLDLKKWTKQFQKPKKPFNNMECKTRFTQIQAQTEKQKLMSNSLPSKEWRRIGEKWTFFACIRKEIKMEKNMNK